MSNQSSYVRHMRATMMERHIHDISWYGEHCARLAYLAAIEAGAGVDAAYNAARKALRIHLRETGVRCSWCVAGGQYIEP